MASNQPQTSKTEEKEDKVENYRERTCAKCQKTGVNLARCSKCKDAYYCNRDCQKDDWSSHKTKCVPPSQRKTIDEEIVAGFVECETYEDCRDYLVKHPELVSKEISDEMFEKGFLALKNYPKEIGTRFIRNAQILQYLLDIRKASGGQQDITLFFTRILDPHNPEYRNNFNQEYLTLVKRIRKRIKEREKEKASKQTNGETSEQKSNA